MMDEKTIQNKDMAQEPKPVKTEYHFAGSGKYKPKTVLADSVIAAQEIWEKTRELVEPEPNNNINQTK